VSQAGDQRRDPVPAVDAVGGRGTVDPHMPAEEAEAPEASPASAPPLASRLFSWRTLLSFLVAAIIVGFAIKQGGINWSDTWDHIRHADVRLYALAFLAFLGSMVVRSVRWHFLLRNAGERCGTFSLFEIIFASFFVNCVIPAKMGDVYRAFLVRQRENVGASKALGTIIAERLLDLVVLMGLLVITGGITFHNRVPGALVPYAIAGALLSAFGISVVVIMATGRGTRLVSRMPARIHVRYENFRKGTVQALSPWPFVALLTVLVWCMEGTRLGLVVAALDLQSLMHPAQFLLVALVAALLTTVPFTPGGLGLVEAGMVGVLGTVADVPRSAAASITVLDRSLSYGAVLVIGFAFFALTHVRQPRSTRLAGESGA
jgi:glycosyltransferase 2 family protein